MSTTPKPTKKGTLVSSFRHAFRGCLVLLGGERNARIQLILIAVAVILGLWVNLNATQWGIVAICSAAVIAAEAFNTAIENLCNHLHPENHPAIKNVKDLSAAAVLLISAGAFVSVCFLLVPRIFFLVSH